ncbi:MAG: 2-hydroxyacyl-CoA dehydratase subunit D [Desulfatirhabdiaceae bacterium]
MTDLFQPLDDIVSSPCDYARAWKAETGRPVVGYMCSYAPEEIITAAGALPFRIFSGYGSISLADAHLQAYSCSLIRGVLEDALSGKLDFLDGMVFPHTCDSIQRLSDIWRINVPTGFLIDVGIPAVLNTPHASAYLTAVLADFKVRVETGLNRFITQDALQKSALLQNAIRTRLGQVYALKQDFPDLISGTQLHTLFQASMIMDREAYSVHLDRILNHLNQMTDSVKTDAIHSAKRVILSGSVCGFSNIYQIVESTGARIVADDFCSGLRYTQCMAPIESDMIPAIAGRYLDRGVCPAKHQGLTSRSDSLIQLAQKHRAEGVIFLLLKFCDPHAFDYPWLKSQLDAAGIPAMLAEIEDQQASEGQLKTRIEAFVEML